MTDFHGFQLGFPTVDDAMDSRVGAWRSLTVSPDPLQQFDITGLDGYEGGWELWGKFLCPITDSVIYSLQPNGDDTQLSFVGCGAGDSGLAKNDGPRIDIGYSDSTAFATSFFHMLMTSKIGSERWFNYQIFQRQQPAVSNFYQTLGGVWLNSTDPITHLLINCTGEDGSTPLTGIGSGSQFVIRKLALPL